tara:strand:- start:330 stop:515 length:186 start_codon:yes stop_codon:yes gene_type:complete
MVSEQVKASLQEAQKHLREALAFAARTESPFVIKSLGEMCFNVEHIQEVDAILEAFDGMED